MGYSVGRTGQSGDLFVIGCPVTLSRTNLALDSAYLYSLTVGTGDAFAGNMQFTEDGTIDGVWIYVHSYTGIWANTDGVINIELREYDAGSNEPGTLVTNGTTTLTLDGATTGWQKATFGTPPSVTAVKPYAIVIGDADGGAVDFVTVGRSVNGDTQSPMGDFAVGTTSTGFAAVGNVGDIPLLGVDVGGVMHGWPFTAVNTRASSADMYGMKITVAFDAEVMGFYGVINEFMDNGRFKVFLASDNDSTSPLKTFPDIDANINNANKQWCIYDSDDRFTLTANTAYYLVLDKDTATTVPRVFEVGTGIDADLKQLFPMAGDVFEVKQNGASFTEDDTKLAGIGVFLRPVQAAGAGGLLIHPSMNGGINA